MHNLTNTGGDTFEIEQEAPASGFDLASIQHSHRGMHDSIDIAQPGLQDAAAALDLREELVNEVECFLYPAAGEGRNQVAFFVAGHFDFVWGALETGIHHAFGLAQKRLGLRTAFLNLMLEIKGTAKITWAQHH